MTCETENDDIGHHLLLSKGAVLALKCS